jgi:hypothetical protein
MFFTGGVEVAVFFAYVNREWQVIAVGLFQGSGGMDTLVKYL